MICELPILKEFGNFSVTPLGKNRAMLEINGVTAETEILIVPVHFLQTLLLVGHTFTEKPNVIAHKTSHELSFIQTPDLDGDNLKVKMFTLNNSSSNYKVY